MKRIALLSDGWKRMMTYAWVDGIMKKSWELEEEIRLYHFVCHGNWSNDELHNRGEYNIFELPELEKMDGIVLDLININDLSIRNRVISKLKKLQVPVVSIALGVEGFYYVGIDNKSAIAELMHHLYEEHKCRSFVFAGGPKDNYENVQRRLGYTECIEEFGLKLEENPTLDGDFDFQHGVDHLHYIVDNGKKIPDAFVCANDNIAAGLCAEAANMGFNIPKDFKVTGFDNLDKAVFFKPQITTVSSTREVTGGICLEMLMKIWAGEEIPKEHLIRSNCVYGESCGCPNNNIVDYRDYAKSQIVYGVKRDVIAQKLMELEVELAKRREFEDIFACSSDHYETMDCDAIYFVVDKKLYEAHPDTIFGSQGYDIENCVVARAVENGELLNISTVPELVNHMEGQEGSCSYTFSPIHFRQQAVGFVVLKNANFLYNNPNFYDIHAACVTALENRFKKKQLESAAMQLRDVYNRDQLTGIYNRIAFVEKMVPAFETFCMESEKCAILFCDVNYFKEINDNFGHEAGDKALKNIAKALKESCPVGGYVCRYGGDEFVVMFPRATWQRIDEYCGKVREDLSKHGLSISMGAVLTDPRENVDLHGYVAKADQKMYEQKQLMRRG